VITLLSEMPSYLTDQLGFDLSSAGLLSVLPYFMLFVFVFGSGRIFHYLHTEGGWTTRGVRQTAQQLGFLGAGLGLILCGFIPNVPVAFTFMVLGQGSLGIAVSGYSCSFLEVAPNHSALLNSIGNTIGSIAGIVSPILVGYLISAFDGTLGWKLLFAITLFLCVVALILWHFYQCNDIVPELNRTGPSYTLNKRDTERSTVSYRKL
jgi:MFS family permease